MTLCEAWSKIKVMDGAENFAPGQVFSILCDWGVFLEQPRIRLATKSALQHGLWRNIHTNDIGTAKLENLRLKLQYDGFSETIINEIISSICNDSTTTPQKQTDGTAIQSTMEDSSKALNSKTIEPIVLGVCFGENIDDAIKILKRGGFKFERYVNIPNSEAFASLKGKFIYYNDCKISLYYNVISKEVYKISIFQDKGLLKDRQCSDIANQIYKLYETKFGTPTCFDRNFNNIKLFKLSSDNIIEIRTNQFILPRIYYINESLSEEANKIIKQKIEADKAAKELTEKKIMNNFLKDI